MRFILLVQLRLLQGSQQKLNPPMAEEIHLRWMKSLRDEICLTAGDGGGFRLSEAARLRFHLRRHAEDFIRACSDFIVRSTISFFSGL